MFGIFNRLLHQDTYVLYARNRVRHWIKQFKVRATSKYQACRLFDTDAANQGWTRVSGATKEN